MGSYPSSQCPEDTSEQCCRPSAVPRLVCPADTAGPQPCSPWPEPQRQYFHESKRGTILEYVSKTRSSSQPAIVKWTFSISRCCGVSFNSTPHLQSTTSLPPWYVQWCGAVTASFRDASSPASTLDPVSLATTVHCRIPDLLSHPFLVHVCSLCHVTYLSKERKLNCSLVGTLEFLRFDSWSIGTLSGKHTVLVNTDVIISCQALR
jgi:hypothetical protein